ncbi:MAG TPA: tetratricopeptide repeat protein [Planctomycetaceae bacterium]|jgi:tetratricopeptide (TPR) repeat protein|nr:tetratricopeptide repeat protein [Planctomycetaceae bacterium]
MSTPRLLPLILIVGSLASSACAQEVGDEVVVASDNAVLQSKKDPKGTVAKGELLTVQKVENDRLLARFADGKHGTIQGWIKRPDVLALPRALEALDDELKRKPTATAYATRARIWEFQHEHEKAIADYGEAIRLDPKQARFYSQRSIPLFHKRRYDQSISDSTEAIRLDPTLTTAYVERAFGWRATGDFEKAFADCDKAIQLNSSFAPAHTARAAVHTTRREYALAIDECTEAIRIDPSFAMAYAGRGYDWYLQRDYAKALADFEAAIKLAPKTAQWYIGRAWCHSVAEEFDESLADLDTAVRLGPNDFPPLLSRAALRATCPYAKYRDGKRSLKDAKKACELTDWKDINCLSVFAAAYAESGDFLNAVKWQETALELVPEKDRQQQSVLRYRLNLYKSHQPYHEKPQGS